MGLVPADTAPQAVATSLAVLAVLAVAGAVNLSTIPAHSVSGFSAGASMAINHLVAHSAVVEGIGIIGAAPYGCNTLYDSGDLQRLRIERQPSGEHVDPVARLRRRDTARLPGGPGTQRQHRQPEQFSEQASVFILRHRRCLGLPERDERGGGAVCEPVCKGKD